MDDKRFKAVKMYDPQTHELLGYQVCEIDETGRLLSLRVDYDMRNEKVFYPTAEEALKNEPAYLKETHR